MVDDNQDIGGFSRRRFLGTSIAAGALVWAAPVLTAGPASAQTDPCPGCPGGTIFNVKLAGQGNAATCVGEACLDKAGLALQGDPECGECLVAGGFIRKESDTVVNGRVREAVVVVTAPLILLSAGMKTTNECIVVSCPDFEEKVIAGKQPAPGTIEISVGPGPGDTTITFDTDPDDTTPGPPLNFVDITVCFPGPGTPAGC